MKSFLALLPLAILALASLLLTGCTSIVPLSNAEIASINRDISATELNKILPKNKVIFKYELPANGQFYSVRHAILKTGEIQKPVFVCVPTCITLFVPVSTTTQYVVIQEAPSGKVFAFGTLDELDKDPDNKVSSIIPAIRQSFREKILQRQAEEREKVQERQSAPRER
jgi:hypothetical protein